MTQDNRKSDIERLTWVAEQEPQARKPPLRETGAISWLRENLFSSSFNAVLTIIGLVLVAYTTVSLTTWIVTRADWFHVTFNFRSYMIGSYSPQYEWRTTVTFLFVVFLMGMAIRTHIPQLARTMGLLVIAVLLAVYGLPLIVNSTVELAPWYTSVGEREIQSGSATEVPIEQIAFVGRAGETVSLQLADQITASEEALAGFAGFVDRPTNTLRNAADNRLANIAERAELEARLEAHQQSEIPQLTDGQVEDVQAQIEALEIPLPVLEDYAINQFPVEVQVLNADTFEPLGAAVTLTTPADVASYDLPEDGWYVLEKRLLNNEAGDAIGLLRTDGIYPVLQSNSFDGETQSFVDSYRRMTDFFQLVEPIPRVDDEEIAFISIIEHKFRGNRTLGDYLRTYTTPFFSRIANHAALTLAIGIAGYALALAIGQVNVAWRNRLTNFGLGLSPVVIWFLINGMYPITGLMYITIAALLLFCVLLYDLGRMTGNAGWSLSRGQGVPIILLAIAGGYGLILLFLALTDGEGGGAARIVLQISVVIMLVAAAMGTGRHIPGEGPTVGRIATFLVLAVVLYVGVLALAVSGIIEPQGEWLLSPSDPRDWRGFLLTMMVTIYGLVLSFPLGIMLALGRRSDLPAVKYACIAFIELIRGSPLITVLFFMQLLIPLVNSDFGAVPNAFRAIIAIVIFSAAYLAENVRGGLQSLPPGQFEAARALGLNWLQMTMFITLPQALRAVIPVLVGQFISLFKDTSLLAIVGLADLTGMVNTIVVQAAFIGTRAEGLLFISGIYFIICYVMSYVSRLLEASGSGSFRRTD